MDYLRLLRFCILKKLFKPEDHLFGVEEGKLTYFEIYADNLHRPLAPCSPQYRLSYPLGYRHLVH